MPTRIILVRHGQSTFNRQGRMQGCNDESRLNRKGKDAAALVGASIESLDIDAILCSPLTRARETAEIIRRSLGRPLPLQLLYSLREAELYQWQGMTFSDIRSEYAEEFQTLTSDPASFSLPQASGPVYPVRDLYHRAAAFWREDFAAYARGTTLLVSHGGTIQALLNTALDCGPENHQLLQVSNCGTSVLDYHPGSKSFTITGLNDTSGIGETLPKLKAGKSGLRAILMPTAMKLDPGELDSMCLSTGINRVFYSGITRNLSAQLQSRNFSHSCSAFEPRARSLAEPLKSCVVEQTKSVQLQNILVLAPPETLAQVMKFGFQVPPKVTDSIRFIPGTVSVLHSSPGHPRPILQCVNIPASSLAGNPC